MGKGIALLSTGFGLGLLVLISWLGSNPAASQDEAKKAKVIYFLATDCPVVEKYVGRLNKLYSTYSAKGVEFQAYFPNDIETPEGVSEFISKSKAEYPWSFDRGAVITRKTGVSQLPTIVIYNEKGEKVYFGTVDDSLTGENIKHQYVKEKLDGILAGKKVSYTETECIGCFVMASEKPPAPKTPTYAEDVANILNNHCVECHRPNEVAPFSLQNYDDAKKWARMISIVTESKKMPPWKAVPNYNEFHDANVLTKEQIDTLKNWAENDAPRGDKSKEPSPKKFSSEWTLGTPDLIASAEKEFSLPAEGKDIYRNFIVKTNFTETKYIKAMNVRPGNPRVVHHVIAFLDEKGRSHSLESKNNDGQPGYSTFGGVGFIPDGALGGWAPGLRPQMTPDGSAFELKPGTTIVLQIHYHLSGKPEKDLTKLGLYFAKEPIKRTMQLAWIANPMFRLKPGDPNAKVQLSYPIPSDVTVYGAMPHMHLLGKSMKAWAELPDKTIKPIVWVSDWDFNWQMNYMFKQPMKLPKGSRVFVEGYYDNSADNPNQPNDPPKEIRWGEETTDEMFLLILPFTFDTQQETKFRKPMREFILNRIRNR